MSLLLGVRSQQSEGQSFHEGIVQQPGSFYNGNPPSSIWGDSPTFALWHDLPTAFSSSSMPASSSVSSPSLTMEKEAHGQQWQHFRMARDKGNQDSSVPSISHSTSLSDTFKFVFKGSAQKPSGTESPTDVLPVAGQKAYVESTVSMENEKSRTGKCSNEGSGVEMSSSLEDLQKDFESKLSVQGASTPLRVPLFQHAHNLEGVKEVQQSHTPESLEDKLSSSSTTWTFGEPGCASGDEETPEVFVFGSLRSSQTGLKAGLQQRKSFNKTFASSSPRLQTSKFKRHSNAVKSTGLAVPWVVGSQQVLSDFYRDLSPQSNTGLDSASRSVHSNDDDTGIWAEEKVDASSHLEMSGLFQPPRVLEQEVGVGSKDDEPTWFSKSGSSSIATEVSHPTQQDSLSHVEGKEPLSKQKEDAASYSYTFSRHFSEEASEPKSDYNAVNLAASIERSDTIAGRPGSSQQKLTSSFAEKFSQNWQNLAKISEPSDVEAISEGNSTKEPIDVATSNVHRQVDSSRFVWNASSQECAKLFTFGASQAPTLQVDSFGGGISSTDKPSVSSPNADPATSTYYSSKSFVDPDNKGPRGEFSGPISSSESETSLKRRDIPAMKEDGFKFLADTKETSHGPVLVKKKPRASSNRRMHGKGLNRQRRVIHSRSFNEASATPMEFSPVTDEPPPIIGATDTDQPYPSLDKQTLNLDEIELWRHATESESLNDHNFGNSQQNMDSRLESLGMSEVLHDWGAPSLSRKRSGKWKRSGFVEGENLTPRENWWALPERKDKSLSGGTTFMFGANSLSPASSSTTETAMGHFYDAQETTDVVSSAAGSYTSTSGQDGFGMARQTLSTDGDGYMHLQGRVGLQRVLRSSSLNGSRTPSQNINAEKRASMKAGDSNSSATGYSFLAEMQDSAIAVKSAAAEQVCERWRLRGNQAYANGDFLKAEEYYSRGASSVSPDETSQSCIRAAMLCYSNRAATRMAVGRMREALADCKRATAIDPRFLRVRLRAASCHLALGDIKEAADTFKDCLKYAEENPPDSKVLGEAMEGVKKCEQVDDYSNRALELLQKQNPTDSTAALRLVNEALSTSPYSEPLHELKGQILLSLRRYEEVLQLCEQSLTVAEKNHGFVASEQPHEDASTSDLVHGRANLHLSLWRWRLNAKALYHLGRLDDALELLTKHEEALATGSFKDSTSNSLAPFMASIRDLLQHKATGNEAFQLGKHAEAVEHYTAALACNGESRPYLAVCFCNRAAASQALGQLADAIADCSRSIALDSVYLKALSRRATLHEMIRDYGQACHDLRRLISLLEEQSNGKAQSNKGGSSSVIAQDFKQARERLEKVEDEMKKAHPINHYLILGIDFSCSAYEIKKAYRKAALKHHPDKAGQFLARGENGDDGSLWKEVGDDVQRDAERLFKLIGEAYAVLSDPTKRLRYDTEEEHLKLKGGKDRNSTQVSGSASEGYRSQYDKSGRRQRDRWDPWQGFPPEQQH